MCSSFGWGFVGLQCEGLDDRESVTTRKSTREREREGKKSLENIWKQDNFSTKNQEGGYAVLMCVRITLFLTIKRK